MVYSFNRRHIEDMSDILGERYSFQFLTNFWWSIYDNTVESGKYHQVYQEIDQLLAEKLAGLDYYDCPELVKDLEYSTKEYRATIFFYGIQLVHRILFSSSTEVVTFLNNSYTLKERGIPDFYALFSKIEGVMRLRYLHHGNRWYNLTRSEIVIR